MEPFFTVSSRRDLREQGWRQWVGRGDNGDANDNKVVIGEMLQARGERARLLSYPTHAHWIADDTIARMPAAALALMLRVWQPALLLSLDRLRGDEMVMTQKLISKMLGVSGATKSRRRP